MPSWFKHINNNQKTIQSDTIQLQSLEPDLLPVFQFLASFLRDCSGKLGRKMRVGRLFAHHLRRTNTARESQGVHPVVESYDNLNRSFLINYSKRDKSLRKYLIPVSVVTHPYWLFVCVSVQAVARECESVQACVCVLGSWANKGRGPLDEPIKKKEEWGRTRRPSRLCPSFKLKMASRVKTVGFSWSAFVFFGTVNK